MEYRGETSMKTKSQSNYKTVIKVFYIMFIMMTLIHGQALAADPTPGATPPNSPWPSYVPTPDPDLVNARQECKAARDKDNSDEANAKYESCVLKANSMFGAQNDSASCNTLATKISDDLNAAAKACAGFEVSDQKGNDSSGKNVNAPATAKALECSRKLNDCNKSSTPGIAEQALGTAMAMPTSKAENCFISPKDWGTEHDRITKDLKTAADDIKSAQEKIIEINTAYSAKVVELQKALTDEQDAFNKKNDELLTAAQEEEKKAMQADIDNNKNLYDLTKQRTDIRNQMQKATSDAQQKMLELSADVTRNQCLDKVEKYKVENQAPTKTSGMGLFVGKTSQQNDRLQVMFTKCNQAYDLARTEVGNNLNATLQGLNEQLSEVERRITELQTLNAQSATQRQQRLDQLNKQKQDAITKATQNTQSLQAQLAQAKTDATSKTQVAQQHLQVLIKNQAALYDEQAALGVKPKASPSNDKALTDWAQSMVDGGNLARSFVGGPCCRLNVSQCNQFGNYADAVKGVKVPSASSGSK
jgi:hypothetical protein